VTCLHTISPGHILTTLYKHKYKVIAKVLSGIELNSCLHKKRPALKKKRTIVYCCSYTCHILEECTAV
jgi:hypothetical protein